MWGDRTGAAVTTGVCCAPSCIAAQLEERGASSKPRSRTIYLRDVWGWWSQRLPGSRNNDPSCHGRPLSCGAPSPQVSSHRRQSLCPTADQAFTSSCHRPGPAARGPCPSERHRQLAALPKRRPGTFSARGPHRQDGHTDQRANRRKTPAEGRVTPPPLLDAQHRQSANARKEPHAPSDKRDAAGSDEARDGGVERRAGGGGACSGGGSSSGLLDSLLLQQFPPRRLSLGLVRRLLLRARLGGLLLLRSLLLRGFLCGGLLGGPGKGERGEKADDAVRSCAGAVPRPVPGQSAVTQSDQGRAGIDQSGLAGSAQLGSLRHRLGGDLGSLDTLRRGGRRPGQRGATTACGVGRAARGETRKWQARGRGAPPRRCPPRRRGRRRWWQPPPPRPGRSRLRGR